MIGAAVRVVGVLTAVVAIGFVMMDVQAPSQNVLTDAERREGWTLLFDGVTTEHWRGYGKTTMPESFKVVNGTLSRVAEGGDITTKDEYGDFELALEWRISEGGNSGVMYRVVESADPPYYTGPEMQVLDDAKHADGKVAETSAGSNYALYAPTKAMAKPVGQWNQARILVRGNHVEHWLNGTKVVEYELKSDDWKARVAKSKFNEWKGYGLATRGRIVLQDHGDAVAYRNIKIRTL